MRLPHRPESKHLLARLVDPKVRKGIEERGYLSPLRLSATDQGEPKVEMRMYTTPILDQ
jgi:hypothetical protein